MSEEKIENRIIEKKRWFEFLDRFSRQHKNWLVTVGVTESSGAQTVFAENARLNNIYEAKGEIAVAIEPPPSHDSRKITPIHIGSPHKIILRQVDDRTHKGLTIESDHGTRLHLEFRSTKPPEMVNGKI